MSVTCSADAVIGWLCLWLLLLLKERVLGRDGHWLWNSNLPALEHFEGMVKALSAGCIILSSTTLIT